MCMICAQWEQGKLTNKEAMNNLGEVSPVEWTDEDAAHFFELVQKIIDSGRRD